MTSAATMILDSIRAEIAAASLDVPPEAARLIATIDALRGDGANGAQLDVDALADALATKTPTAALRAFHAAVADVEAAKAACQHRAVVVNRLAARAVQTLRTGDQILHGLRPRFDAAAARVATAHRAGVRPGTTADAALRLGSDVGAAYLDNEAAVADLDQIRSLVLELRPDDLQHPYRVARWITAANITTGRTMRPELGMSRGYVWTDLDEANDHDGWLTLIGAGHTLHLNTDHERDHIVARHEQIEHDTNRASHQPWFR